MNQSTGQTFKKKILIFGSSSFLGKNLIKKIFKSNDIICVDKFIEKKLFSENIDYYKCDVNNFKSLFNIKKKIERKHKFVDIIINCFVEQNYNSFENQTIKKFKNSLITNVAGIFTTTKIFYKLLEKSKKPQIINLGSIYGLVSGDPTIYPDKQVTSDVYAASKAAIIQLSRYYAIHLSKYRIRVNCISPGGIFNDQKKTFVRNYIKKVPMKRMAEVDEIVSAIEFMLSEKSSYLNGHNLVIDGGFTSW